MQFKSIVVTAIALAAVVAVGAAQGRPGDGITKPVVLKDVKPVYTAAAMEERIQGSVLMDAVVLEDGTVGDVQVTQSLDVQYGLDEEAVRALKQWQFRPGTKDGTPVAVTVSIEMTFKLK